MTPSTAHLRAFSGGPVNREHRTFRNVEIRAQDEAGPSGRPVITLRAITPAVVDDYGSLWNPRAFDGRVEERMAADADDTPTLCWAHKWEDPIGHGFGYRGADVGPELDFELDEFDAVPRAKQAYAQTRSKTIRDCSVGFSNVTRRPPTDAEVKQYPGIKEVIEEADLDEVSLVLRGAVPGAKVMAVRSMIKVGQVEQTLIREVPVDFVVELGKKIAAGELTHAEADAAIALAGGGVISTPPVGGPTDTTGDDTAELDAVLAEAAELLDQ